MCAFVAGGLFQFLGFVIGTTLDSPQGQYLLFAAPTGALSGLAVAMGLTVIRRQDGDRWVAGIAGAGVIVGGVGLVVTLVGIVLALTLGDSGQEVFF